MDDSLYKAFNEVEETMWWFKARKKIIEQFVRKISKDFSTPKILDFGAGLGNISKMMSQYGSVTAVDNSKEASRFSRFPITVMDNLESVPDRSFHIITAFDVLEHCEDDTLLLADFKRIVSPNGYIFVTVPAFHFL